MPRALASLQYSLVCLLSQHKFTDMRLADGHTSAWISLKLPFQHRKIDQLFKGLHYLNRSE